ncbi:uncharacterized protein G2W53_027111 [Senna tora]|uniref:Uncharacterized protein n=1 Tax=Senna tora TaxID=362788 RepID=A0A834TIC6_9FABA|nr:uncharacterized protein G2W53_027111 [Senna tora]
MKAMTQGNLPRIFREIRLVRGQIFDGQRCGSPSEASQEFSRRSESVARQVTMWIAVHQKSKSHGSTFFNAKSHMHMLGQNEAYDTTKTSQEVSRQSDLRAAKSSTDDEVDCRRSATLKTQSPMAFDTRKPPKKFQGNPTCARPNLRWTTTWIAVKSHVHMLVQMKPMTQGNLPRTFKAIHLAGFQIFDGRRRGSPSVGDTQNSITHGGTMIPMTQGSLPRSFKAIHVGRPLFDHVDRRPSEINESRVNFFSMQNLTCICWVKMKPMTQGNHRRNF